MTENALPPLRMVIDNWRIASKNDGRILLWIVPGYTHVIGTTN